MSSILIAVVHFTQSHCCMGHCYMCYMYNCKCANRCCMVGLSTEVIELMIFVNEVNELMIFGFDLILILK